MRRPRRFLRIVERRINEPRNTLKNRNKLKLEHDLEVPGPVSGAARRRSKAWAGGPGEAVRRAGQGASRRWNGSPLRRRAAPACANPRPAWAFRPRLYSSGAGAPGASPVFSELVYRRLHGLGMSSPSPRLGSEGCARSCRSQARPANSFVSVWTLTISPSLMNRGTRISSPVSSRATLVTLPLAVSPREPGSVSVTVSSTMGGN